MRAKPLLVAAATFLIVLLGGVAVAGVGTFGADRPATSGLGVDPVIDAPDVRLETAPVAETDTAAHIAREGADEDTPTKQDPAVDEPVKDEPKDEDVVKEEPKDEDDASKDDEKVEDDPVDLFSIMTPADGSHVTSKTITFSGTVADGATVTRGKYTAETDDGTWKLTLVLSPGTNTVTFQATAGDVVEKETIVVHYDAPESEKKDDGKGDPGDKGDKDPGDIAFTAKQKYGSCGEGVPYDVFSGTAQPGTKITVTSPYGSGSTTAGDKGHWDLKVKFPDAPKGEKFTATVSAATGESASFTFVNTGGHDDEKDPGKDH